MAEYKSETIALKGSAEAVYDKMANLENLKSLLDQAPKDRIPADKLEQLERLEITPDSITIPGGPMGAVTLEVARRRKPDLIELQAARLPVPVKLALHIQPVSDTASLGTVAIDADIPAMLKPMVSGPLKKILEQCATILGFINFGD